MDAITLFVQVQHESHLIFTCRDCYIRSYTRSALELINEVISEWNRCPSIAWESSTLNTIWLFLNHVPNETSIAIVDVLFNTDDGGLKIVIVSTMIGRL